MPPTFPNTQVKSVVSWTNYPGTISGRPIPVYCTPAGSADAGVMRMHGDAVRSILEYCFRRDPPASVRALGSTWSFSRVIEPGEVAIDPANFTFIERIPRELFSADYRDRAAQGFVPMFVEGGAQIGAINRRLGADVRLALQTSGASDGHRIAGCIATGTHGSALGIGALHDTVLGLYLVVAPGRAVFVQSGSSPFSTDGVASWLENQTGIPTTNLADDGVFRAALVALGSLGIVFGVVVETVPLYRLKFKTLARPFLDNDVWAAVRSLDTSPLHPEIADRPYHFDVVMHPYPPTDGPGLVVTLMWKTVAGDISANSPLPAVPRASSDLMGLISRLADALGSRLTAPLELPLVQQVINQQIAIGSPEGEAFPGQMFGPSGLPPGSGASTEIVVNHADADRALRVVYRILGERRNQGQFLLGVIGVRFVPATRALLGMNVFPMNCYIELPSIRDDAVLDIYRAVWDALESEGIVFTCHWGQLHAMTPARLSRYFGDRIDAWKAARARLLDEIGRRVFAAPILGEVGLDS